MNNRIEETLFWTLVCALVYCGWAAVVANAAGKAVELHTDRVRADYKAACGWGSKEI